MSHYIEKVTVSLENLISELARNPSLFLKNPDTDFSRNRKINFKTCVGITMNSGGCTLNKELLDFFDFDVNAPTVSAYTQQRAKILPEAFEYLFHAFTEENAQTKNLYEGYITNKTWASRPSESQTSGVSKFSIQGSITIHHYIGL